MDASQLAGPFEGITVLSLAEQYPGPFASMLMADLGADVILVERPQGGDPARAFPAVFASMARNKRSVCLDLKTEGGRADLKQLVANADVLLEGFRPGTMDRLGFSYRKLAEAHPRLIYASISGFGQDGPYRDRVAHDLSYQAVSGMLFDRRDELPEPPSVSFGDLSGAMFAAFGVAAALFGRERTGRGTYIDVSMTDGLVSWMTAYLGPALNQQPMFGILSEPAYGSFRCSDGTTLTLSVAHEDHFWKPLCAILGLEAHASLNSEQRIRQSAELRASIRTRVGAETLEHWSALFDRAGIPWSPLHSLDEVVADPHFAFRGIFGSIAAAAGARTERYVRQPLVFSAFGSAVRLPSPGLGEHTAEILGRRAAE